QPRSPPRRSSAAGTNARQHAARVRLLPPVPRDGHRAAAWADGPHARGRPDLRDHLVRRQQRLPALRTAADAAIRKPGGEGIAGSFGTPVVSRRTRPRQMKCVPEGGHAAMKTPSIVSPQEWEAARKTLLVKEKGLTGAREG